MNWFDSLKSRIIKCSKCPRLVNYRKKILSNIPRKFRNYKYWGRPLPSFGEMNSDLMIIGLAPAAHGGFRTGRMFTGDHSGNWVAKGLYIINRANKPESINSEDGLKVKAYITAAVRCPPPDNLPKSDEIRNCNLYLVEELKNLKNIKVILTLGHIALKSIRMALKELGIDNVNLKFKHGAIYKVEDYSIISSYHPSRRNTQTGLLTEGMWRDIFFKVNDLLKNK